MFGPCNQNEIASPAVVPLTGILMKLLQSSGLIPLLNRKRDRNDDSVARFGGKYGNLMNDAATNN
jgi:hypothetical protein